MKVRTENFVVTDSSIYAKFEDIGSEGLDIIYVQADTSWPSVWVDTYSQLKDGKSVSTFANLKTEDARIIAEAIIKACDIAEKAYVAAKARANANKKR